MLWRTLSGIGRTEPCGGPTCTHYAPGKTRVPLVPRSVSYAERFRADAAFMDTALEGGKGGVGLIEGRSELSLILDQNVVLLVMFGVCQLDGGGRRLGLGGLHAPLDVVEGHPQHLLLGVGGKGVQEGGEGTHVCRRGGKRGGDRETGVLVPSAVEAWMSGRPEKKWCRGRNLLRICPCLGQGRSGLRRRS